MGEGSPYTRYQRIIINSQTSSAKTGPNNSLPTVNMISIQIKKGTKLLLGPIYLLSVLELKTLQEFIEENLKSGLICPSCSSCSSPVLFVQKKDDSLCLCIDYKELNKITCKNCYPIPLISDLLDFPKKTRVYSKIDLHNTYHLVHIAKGDEWKTTFCTCYSFIEWLVMPFELSNTPFAFQQLMNKVFADFLNVSVVIYLDDILIYSDNLLEHKKHVKEVLYHLRNNGLYAFPTKCIFHQQKIEFLAY